jgi:outer membrane protein OmpA-like peptidoglycan-associated protein
MSALLGISRPDRSARHFHLLFGLLPTHGGCYDRLRVEYKSSARACHSFAIHGITAFWAVDRMMLQAPDLYFDLNSHVLQAPEQRKLAPAFQDILNDSPELIIVIEGYSDDRGLPEYNQRLALLRTDAVRRSSESQFPGRLCACVQFRRPRGAMLNARVSCRQKHRRVHFRATQ